MFVTMNDGKVLSDLGRMTRTRSRLNMKGGDKVRPLCSTEEDWYGTSVRIEVGEPGVLIDHHGLGVRGA